jgi:dethiobiotin synthetase
MRGLFVTGTDTGAGKTVLSACLLAAMAASGRRVVAHKPVLTGLEDAPEGSWPADDELLASITGVDRAEVSPLRFGPAVSPHLAAELAGVKIERASLLAGADRAWKRAQSETAKGEESGDQATLLVEGVGGLLVPLAGSYLVADLASDLALPLLIAARPGLGTINHTLLTLRAARAAGLKVLAVVLGPWPQEPGPIERSNRETIERLGEVEVASLPLVAAPEPAMLVAAGESLPWRRWLSGVSE